MHWSYLMPDDHSPILRFSGKLPSLANLTALKSLTAFQNRFTGRLSLPKDVDMTILFIHRNRLSCAVDGPGTTVDRKNYPLVLPSNGFSAPTLSWFTMGRVDAMVVRDTWATWGTVLLSLGTGIVALALAVGFVLHPAASPHCKATCNHWLGAMRAFVCFSPKQGIEQLQVTAGRCLAVWSLFAAVWLVPLYLAAPNWYECGEVRLCCYVG